MIVEAQILAVDVEPHINTKTGEIKGQKATLAFMTSSPTEPHISMFWNNDIEQGKHVPFQKMIGKKVQIAVQPEIFNSKLQMRVLSSFVPKPIADPFGDVPDKKAS